jgi:sortase A
MKPDFFQRLRQVTNRQWIPRAHQGLSILQLSLWGFGIVALGFCVTGYTVSAWHQAQQKAIFEELSSARRFSAPEVEVGGNPPKGGPFTSRPAAGGLIGVIEIPRLNISSVVDEGVDNKTLLVAVGHVPGTAFPGEPGNTALAAHRDTFFRELGQLHAGDDITLTTLSGAYRYKVEATRIVDPSAREVLNTSSGPTLTLITCYPFHYVGPAPRRFIVVARQDEQPKPYRASQNPPR